MGSEIKITIYQNGYVVYQNGETTTVFPVHKCGDFVEHDRTGREHVMPYEVFADQPWQMRIYLEGERRIWHNKKAVPCGTALFKNSITDQISALLESECDCCTVADV